MLRITIPTVLAIVFFAACGNDPGSKGDKNATEVEAKSSAVDHPDFIKGLELAAASDCGTCHKVEERLVGPGYREIAAKYSSQSDSVLPYLASKIIKGGSGVWGQVPMAPHPGISGEDAVAMAKYILLHK